ncbi:ABC transporter substrate-binding protein [Nocardia alni]|uniref:ABC transporter substrate-binding protein n=1 Tax=Nocardia alni TaxID=2815723 RepID=UPI001C23AE6B|nr:ABC transporter substrate-binding protein [Nocardia alni]
MKIYKHIIAAVLALVLAAALTACGSTGVDRGVIRVGMICSCSGSMASALGRSADVMHAWEKSVNAEGGINGVKVKLYVEDDAADPAKGLQAAKELVEKRKVVAIVGDGSVVDGAWADYVDKKGIPVVGGEPVFPPFATKKSFFPVGGSLAIELYSSFVVGKQLGTKKVGFLYCAESPVCANIETPASKYAASLGLGFESAKVSATAPDYNAVCLDFKNSGVDGMIVVNTAPVAQRIVDSCAAQGFTPRILGQTGSASVQWLADPNLEGATVTSVDANNADESIPGVRTYLDAVDKYLPGLRNSQQFSYPLFWMWAGGKLFEAAAAAGKITANSTAANVTAGLYDLSGETLDGIAPPLTFTKGKAAFIPCRFDVTLRHGAFVSQGTEPICMTPAQQKVVQDAGVF